MHNYVIYVDKLNFLGATVGKKDMEVEPLEDGPAGNVGYLPVAPVHGEGVVTESYALESRVSSRMNLGEDELTNPEKREDVMEDIISWGLMRPLHNIREFLVQLQFFGTF